MNGVTDTDIAALRVGLIGFGEVGGIFGAARRYGVEREVLASLAETFPGLDWERQATWFWRRVVQHGRRRAGPPSNREDNAIQRGHGQLVSARVSRGRSLGRRLARQSTRRAALFTAGDSAGGVTVRGTSLADPSRFRSTIVTVASLR